MTITQYNSSNSINELRWKKEMIWMNSLTYRPRLKKDLWSKFRFGPKIRTTRPAESEIRPKIHYWSTIHCVSKSANPLDLPQNSTIQALFKAKSVHPKTYSPPSWMRTNTIWQITALTDISQEAISCWGTLRRHCFLALHVLRFVQLQWIAVVRLKNNCKMVDI